MTVAAQDVARVLADVFAEPLDDLGSTSRGIEALIAHGTDAVMALINDARQVEALLPRVWLRDEPPLAARQVGDVWGPGDDRPPVYWTTSGWVPTAYAVPTVNLENQE